MKRKMTIFLAFLLSLKAAAGPYLSPLTSANSGLSNDNITVLCHDSRGFMWIGSASGLNRFDGHNMQTFRDEDLGLYSDFVRSLYEDSSGDLRIGTEAGVSMYDRDMDIFVPLLMQSDLGCVISKRVPCIAEDRDGKIWFSVGDQGLFRYDKDAGALNQFFYRDSTLMNAGVNDFAFDNAGGVLMVLYRDKLCYFTEQSFRLSNCPEAVMSVDFFRARTVVMSDDRPGLTIGFFCNFVT